MKAKKVRDILNEAKEKQVFDYFLDDREFSSGEKAAISQRKEVLTKQQMAACYLNAEAAMNRKEDKGNYAANIAMKMNRESGKPLNFKDVPGAYLGCMIDIGPATASWTVRKFKLLFDGHTGEDPKDYLSPKYIEFFKHFKRMPASEVNNLALEVVNPDASLAAADKYLEEVREKQNEYAQKAFEKKSQNKKMKNDMMEEIINVFVQYNTLGEKRAKALTLKAISTKYKMSELEIEKAIKADMKEPSIRKIFLNP